MGMARKMAIVSNNGDNYFNGNDSNNNDHLDDKGIKDGNNNDNADNADRFLVPIHALRVYCMN